MKDLILQKFYYTSTDFSLYKSKSILFADFIKITVKTLSLCNSRLSPCKKVFFYVPYQKKVHISENIKTYFKLKKTCLNFSG